MLPWSFLPALCSISTIPAQIKSSIISSLNLQNTFLACVQDSSSLAAPMHVFHCHKNYLSKTQIWYSNYWLESIPFSPGVHKGYILQQHLKFTPFGSNLLT